MLLGIQSRLMGSNDEHPGRCAERPCLYNPNSLQFVPPRGLEKATPDEALTEFSYEAIQQRLSEGCELWAVRLPSGVRSCRSLFFLSSFLFFLSSNAVASCRLCASPC